MKFSALDIIDPEDSCIICYEEYTEEAEVTKLSCNEKHLFHTKCIESWISQGHNSCPNCRAPIADLDLPGNVPV